jgi:WD40 repeat protein
MKTMRIYDAFSMKLELDIICAGVILAIEFAPDKNAICVSLSDRTIIFYDASTPSYKIVRKLNVPSTQKCLCYIKRKHILFSAGTDGAIFAWNMNKIFSNDFSDDEV